MACLSPYKIPQNNEGRFLQWTAINYFLEDQTEPIEICASSADECIYEFPDETESYQLPIQKDDVIQWIMNKDEFTIDAGSSLSDIKIGIVHEGVLVASDIGTITDNGGSEYFCTATIPCLDNACDYQFVIYDSAFVPPIECGIYEGAILQDVIDDNIYLSQVLDCTLNDFL